MKKLWKVFENFSNRLERARSIVRWNDAREQYPGTSLMLEHLATNVIKSTRLG